MEVTPFRFLFSLILASFSIHSAGYNVNAAAIAETTEALPGIKINKPLMEYSSPVFYYWKVQERRLSRGLSSVRKRSTTSEEEHSKDDLETSERIIFRPLFRHRQIVAERERRFKERQEIRRMEYCKKYFYKCWPQFKDRYYNNRDPYTYSTQGYYENNVVYNPYPYYTYRPTHC